MSARGAIYSIGYSGLVPADIVRVCDRLDATLVDVRAVPCSRKPGFSGAALAALLGPRYEHRLDLGNPDKIGRAVDSHGALLRLTQDVADGRRIVLMCLEHAPGDCHRHFQIAEPLIARGVDVRHIYEGEVFTASALQASIDADMRADAALAIRLGRPLKRSERSDVEYQLLDEPSPLEVES